MGIGTSLGAYYEDDFQHHAGVITPPKESETGDKKMEKSPNSIQQDKQLEEVGNDILGGTEVGLKRVYITTPSKVDIDDRQDQEAFQPSEDGPLEWLDDKWHQIKPMPPHTELSKALGSESLEPVFLGKKINKEDPEKYETELSEAAKGYGSEEDFQKWKKEYAPNDSGEDYDLRGAFMHNVKPDPATGHWPDTYKKPNHPTFSDQSIYAKDRPDLAGTWDGDRYIPSIARAQQDNMSSGSKVVDRLFGLGGIERYKLWPERMLEGLQDTAKKVSAGEIPMWAMTPDGEFHTSIEGLEAAHALMPAANGGIFPKIHLRGEGLKALETYHEASFETTAADQFQQLLRQTRRQPSNIRDANDVDSVFDAVRSNNRLEPATPRVEQMRDMDHLSDAEFGAWMRENINRDLDNGVSPTHGAEGRRTATEFASEGEVNPYFPERFRGLSREQAYALNDEQFYDYGSYQSRGQMSEAMEARWNRLDRQYAEDMASAYESDGGMSWDIEPGPNARPQGADVPRYWNRDIRDKLEAAAKGDKLKMFKDEQRSSGRNHEFKFANKDGIGKLNITEKRGGKELYVDLIGRVDKSGYVNWNSAQSFGTKEIKDLVKQLMVEFPRAEEVVGFRVSGARLKSGGGEAKATMKLPGRGPRHNRGPRLDN